MKILCVTQYYPPHVGGLEVVAQKQAQSLARQGNRVEVVTFACGGTSVGTSVENQVVVHRVRGIRTLDEHFGIPFVIGGIGLVRTIFRVVRSVDAVHLHDVFYPSSWITYLAVRWHRKSLLLTQHVGMVAHTSKLVTFVQRVVYRLVGRLIFQQSVRIIVYNPIVRTFLEGEGVEPHKIVDLRNGVDLTKFRPGEPGDREAARRHFNLPQNRPLALFVGRFVPKKGYQEVFDARDEAYDLVFVGTGHTPPQWKTTPGVHMLGALTQEELSLLYRGVEAFVLPARGEMFTLAMQEALASGVPVITTDESAYAMYNLDKDRIILCAPQATVIQHELKRVMGDALIRERMAGYAVSLAREWFDWEKNVAPMIALYDTLFHTRTPIVTTSWDDGHVLDTKLAQLLDEYGVQGTFYVAPRNRECRSEEWLSEEDMRALAKKHEIGAHTMTHRWLTNLNEEEARKEMADSRAHLERVLGTPVTSFCYPAGKHTKRDAQLACDVGFRLARTVRRFSTTVQDPHELHTTIHTYDHWLDVWPLLKFVRFNPLMFLRLYRRWDVQAMALFDQVLEEGGVFHLWGHSWEIERHKDWDRLARVLKHISGHAEVHYTTNGSMLDQSLPDTV